MANFPKPGATVYFLDRNGYDHDLAEARQLFKKGDALKITETNVGDWRSSFRFEGHGNKTFNTVMFGDKSEVDPAPRPIPEFISTEQSLRDKIEDLEKDLDAAIEVIFKSDSDWVHQNHPGHYSRLIAKGFTKPK